MRGEVLGVERRLRRSDDDKLSIISSVGIGRERQARRLRYPNISLHDFSVQSKNRHKRQLFILLSAQNNLITQVYLSKIGSKSLKKHEILFIQRCLRSIFTGNSVISADFSVTNCDIFGKCLCPTTLLQWRFVGRLSAKISCQDEPD
jgi:hypothetical protein